MKDSHNRILTCNCKKTVTVELSGVGCYNVAEAEQKSGGWSYIPLFDGGRSWLCPDCGKEAKRLANELVKIVGNENFPISSFSRVKI